MLTAGGAVFLWLSFMLWFRPNSNCVRRFVFERYPPEADANRLARFVGYTRETFGPVALWQSRVVAPFGGLFFAAVGIVVLIGEFTQCAHPNFAVRLPNFTTGIHFRYWPQMLPFTGVAVAIAVVSALRLKRLIYKILFVLLAALWAASGAEGAAFHTGDEANTWFIVGMMFFALAGVVLWLGQRKGQ